MILSDVLAYSSLECPLASGHAPETSSYRGENVIAISQSNYFHSLQLINDYSFVRNIASVFKCLLMHCICRIIGFSYSNILLCED